MPPRGRNNFIRPTSQGTIFEISAMPDNLAFLLGAGIDKMLTNSKAPSWDDLISKTSPSHCNKYSSNPEYISLNGKYCSNWPTETAFGNMWFYGKSAYFQKIDEKVNIGGKFRFTGFINDLCKAMLKSRLIVSLNYSNLVEVLLKNYIAKSTDSNIKALQLIVIERKQLTSILLTDNILKNKVYFIYLHGHCKNYSSDIIFDSWSYNSITNEDKEYGGFLQDLFTHKKVISIGCSLRDYPLRNAAAFVQRTKTYLYRKHLSFIYLDDKFEILQAKKSCGRLRTFSNVMKASYGIDLIFTNKSNQNKIFTQVFIDKNEIIEKESLLSNPTKFADALDIRGDYESTEQNKLIVYLSQNEATSDHANITTIQKGISNFLIKYYNDNINNINVENWISYARIENHLRHYIWLYCIGDNYTKIRKKFWRRLYKTYFDCNMRNKRIEKYILFNFIIGCYEHKTELNNIEYFKHSFRSSYDCKYKRRLEYAPDIWTPLEESNIDFKTRMVPMLLTHGWESMASKVLLDIASFRLKQTFSLDKDNEPEFNVIYNMAEQAEVIAKYSGCMRRVIKSEVIKAICCDNPGVFYNRLLGQLRALEEQGILEPGLYATIAAGIAICQIKTFIKYGKQYNEGNISDTLINSGLDKKLIKSPIYEYWATFYPPLKQKDSKHV